MKSGRFFGEPAGVGYLAFTEAWERFSFYGMGALVVLYMTQSLLLPGHIEHVAGFAIYRRLLEGMTGPLPTQALASMTYGLYAGLIYFTPLLGGLLADRVLGARRTVIIGAVLLCGGHLAMAFDQSFLLAGLLLIVGCGCLKGNISAQVGGLYDPADDAGRTRGFTIFSMGINVGAVTGPLVCGLLAQIYGWHAGFGLAGVLMMAGLITYLLGLKHLPPEPARQAREAAPPLDRAGWLTIGWLTAIIAITIFQSVSYYQIGNVGLVWIAEHVSLKTPVGSVPVAWFNSIDSFISIIAVPPLFALWAWQARRGREPSDLGKIGIGAAICAVSAALPALGAVLAGSGGKVNVLFPLIGFSGMGVAFLYYWPTLLALVSRKTPPGTAGVMLGVAFCSLFVGNLAMGWLGTLYGKMTPAAFWGLDAAIGAVGAVLVLVFRAVLAERPDAPAPAPSAAA